MNAVEERIAVLLLRSRGLLPELDVVSLPESVELIRERFARLRAEQERKWRP